TRPAAFSGATAGTGSGGVSSRSVAVLVAVWFLVAIRCPLPAFATVLSGQDTRFKAEPAPNVPHGGYERKRILAPAARGLTPECRRPIALPPPGRRACWRTARPKWPARRSRREAAASSSRKSSSLIPLVFHLAANPPMP